MNVQLFYMQDSRSTVGNDMCFWATNGGYTTDLLKANVFTFEQAQSQHNCRETDIPWPKEYIDDKTRPAVDVQYVNRDDALQGTGIVINVPKRPRRWTHSCLTCGKFITVADYYGNCPHCHAENCP